MALAVRILVVTRIREGYAPLTDAADFDRWAISLAEDHRFPQSALAGVEGPTAFRAPAFPVLLAAVYVVAGHSLTGGLVLNALLGAAAVVLLATLAWQVWDRRVGVVVGFLAALHPTMVLFGSGLQLEPLLLCTVIGSLVCAFGYRSTPHPGWLLGAGALVGLALLTREIAWPLLFVDAALLAGSIGTDRRWARVRVVFAFWAVAGLVVLPWLVRNQQRFDQVVLISTSPNVALAGTYNEESRQSPEAPWLIANDGVIEVIDLEGRDGEVAVADELGRRTRAFVAEHPAYVVKAAFWNFVRLFDLDGTENAALTARFTPYPERLNEVAVYSSYVVELLAIIGIALGAHRAMPRYVWLVPLAAIATTVLVFGMIRYRASIEPFTVLLAGAGLVAAASRYRLVASVRKGTSTTA